MVKMRFPHSFSLDENKERELQEVLTKMKGKYRNFGIIDIIYAGIARFKYHEDFEREALKHKDIKFKK